MKKSLKQKLALLLALVMLFAMALPTGLIAGAAEGDDDAPVAPVVPADPGILALDGEVTDKVDLASVQATGITTFAGEGVENLFNTALNTKICGNIVIGTPVEILFNTTEAVAIQSYALTSAADSAAYNDRDPKNWTLYGSADNVDFAVIDSRVGQGFGKNGETKVYPFANDKAYKYYKLVITDLNGASMMQLCSLRLSTAKLDDLDADAAAAVAAAAFDAKLAAFGELATMEEKVAQMGTLRAEFEALDTVTKAKVTKLNLLKEVEAYQAKLTVLPKLEALVAEIEEDMANNPDPDTGLYDYHISGKITDALALAKDLGDAAAGIDTAKLEGYRATLDEALLFDTTVGNVNGGNATKNPWLTTMDEAGVEATKAATVDELKWQYTRAGYLLGTGYLNGEVNLASDWGAQLMAQLEGADGVTSPWNGDQPTRKWSAVMVPFAGTAFSATGYMAGTDVGFTVLSDSFIYNGRVYQQRWDCIMSYEYGYEAPYVDGLPENAVVPVLQQETSYPGYTGGGDATNNTFRLAYALYNTQFKLDGKVLGIASANAVVGDKVIYQQFESVDGIAYIAGSTSLISAVDANAPERKAFVVYGDILDAIMGDKTFAEAIEITGAPITDVVDGEQMFENGVATAKGFVPYAAEDEYRKVIVLIDGLPTTITRDNLDAVEASIKVAKDAYDALTANKDKVENYETLAELETAHATFKANVVAADAVAEMINKLPVAANVTFEDKEAIEAARDAYDKLTEDQQALIPEAASLLIAAENALQVAVDQAAGKAVEDMISALPEDEEIDGEDFETAAAAVEAAEEAYKALSSAAARYVDDAFYDALMQKIDIVAAGGYTKWSSALPGDVDGDGNVNVSDIIKVKNLIMAGEWSDAELAAGDMNNSGKLDVADIIAIKNQIMGA